MNISIILQWAVFALLQLTFVSSDNSYRRSFINPYPRFKTFNDNGDPGEPLFLTPLIQANNISEAREKAKVDGTNLLSVESYSGYLTVDKSFNSNLFFWYFPAEEDPIYAPVVLWLQGGPGASSLFGLFNENGPFELQKKKKKIEPIKREFRWNKRINMIYIDNPVGTGFSFTDKLEGYARNEKQVAHNLYEAVKQLFLLFNFNSVRGFWITGESYAGKYVPALAYYMHIAKNSVHNDVNIPLKGIAIGNGFSDPQHQLDYGDYLYQLGLIDLNGNKEFQIEQKKGIEFIHQHKMSLALGVFNSLINVNNSTNKSLFYNLTNFQTYFNYLKTKPDKDTELMGHFLQSSIIRRAIHVGNNTFHDATTDNKVELNLEHDIMDSVAPWIVELLDLYKVCIYNGQLDVIVAYPMTVNYLQTLKFKDAAEYLVAPRTIWKVGNEIAGYKKEGGNLIEVMVRNAGHMVPMDQPSWMYDLITELTKVKD